MNAFFWGSQEDPTEIEKRSLLDYHVAGLVWRDMVRGEEIAALVNDEIIKRELFLAYETGAMVGEFTLQRNRDMLDGRPRHQNVLDPHFDSSWDSNIDRYHLVEGLMGRIVFMIEADGQTESGNRYQQFLAGWRQKKSHTTEPLTPFIHYLDTRIQGDEWYCDSASGLGMEEYIPGLRKGHLVGPPTRSQYKVVVNLLRLTESARQYHMDLLDENLEHFEKVLLDGSEDGHVDVVNSETTFNSKSTANSLPRSTSSNPLMAS